MYDWRSFVQAVGHAPVACGVLALSVFWGIAQAAGLNGGEWDSPAALALWAVVAAIRAMRQIGGAPDEPGRDTRGELVAWLVVVAAAGVMVWSNQAGSAFGKNSALLLVALGIGCYGHGWRVWGRMGLPLIVCFWLLPFLEYLTLWGSYPLRLISTAVSVAAFRLCGADISAHLTTIYIGKSAIAITDACSGISQLGVLLFLAYLVSLALHTRNWLKLVWLGFLLPIVLLANTVRLMLTIGLFLLLGERAFDDVFHVGLGYFFVLLTTLLLWWSRNLIPQADVDGEDS